MKQHMKFIYRSIFVFLFLCSNFHLQSQNKNAATAIYSGIPWFDDKGNITRKDPEEVIKNELVIRPGIFYRKSENEYIIYASRKSKDKIGRMILNE